MRHDLATWAALLGALPTLNSSTTNSRRLKKARMVSGESQLSHLRLLSISAWIAVVDTNPRDKQTELLFTLFEVLTSVHRVWLKETHNVPRRTHDVGACRGPYLCASLCFLQPMSREVELEIGRE